MRRLLAFAFIPALMAALVGLAQATPTLPLVDFANPRALGQWNGLQCTGAQVQGVPAIRLDIPAWVEGQDEWPAACLAYDDGRGYATRDWSPYGKVACEVWISGDEPADLALELRDHQGRNGVITHFTLEPGQVNYLQMALPGAPINLANVEEIVFFSTCPPRDFTVTLANLCLLPADTMLYPEARVYCVPLPILVDPWPCLDWNWGWYAGGIWYGCYGYYVDRDRRRHQCRGDWDGGRRDFRGDRDSGRPDHRGDRDGRGGLGDRGPITRGPSDRAPTYRGPVSRGPSDRAPTYRGPVIRGPITRDPAYRAPVTRDPAYRAPVTRDPAYRAPVTRDPAYRAPVTRDPAYSAPATRDPVARGPITRGPSGGASTSRGPASGGGDRHRR
jgi:hypothetical protein